MSVPSIQNRCSKGAVHRQNKPVVCQGRFGTFVKAEGAKAAKEDVIGGVEKEKRDQAKQGTRQV